MKKQTLSQSNRNLWLLTGRVSHEVTLVRQKELRQFHIPVRQLYVLHNIQALGSKATISEVAKRVERKYHVVAKQVINMEKDGLIKRIKNTPKSNLLRLKLAQKPP